MNSVKFGQTTSVTSIREVADAGAVRNEPPASIGFGPSSYRGAILRPASLAAAAVLFGALAGCQSGPQARAVTLNWMAPITETDGSALTGNKQLTSYKVFYGTTSRAVRPYLAERDVGLPSCVSNAGSTWCTYRWLDTQLGQNCFSVTAINRPNGTPVESDKSGEACITLTGRN